jgi:hypothetical protein
MMTRLVGASAVVAPLTPVEMQVCPAATPVKTQDASQFASAAMLTVWVVEL